MPRLPRFLLALFRPLARGAVLQPAPAGSAPAPDTRSRVLATALLFVSASVAALAQSVSWDPPAGTLARGQTSELSLVFENCAPSSDDVQLPVVNGLRFGRPSVSNQTSMINFKTTRRVILAYPSTVTAGSGRIVIPEFEIDTDSGKQRVAAAAYDVGEATVGRSNVPIERVASAELEADPAIVWAGQVFDLNYRLLVSRRFNPTGVGNLDWTPPASLVSEQLAKFENVEATVGGDPRVGVATHGRAYIKDPGTVSLPAAHQPVSLLTGNNAFDFFGRQSTEQYLITSTAPTLLVKALPKPAPASFLGAVGQFKFTGKVVPTTAAVGEPITWTLSLEGTGNWPDGLNLPEREVSRDFRAFQPNVQRKIKDGTLFEGTLTEDIVLMPTKPGTYTLGPVSYAYFDPASGTYKTVRSEAVKVTVTPAVAASTALSGTGTSTQPPVLQFGGTDQPAKTPDTSSAVVKSPAPELPGHLPMEPLERSAHTRRPWASVPLGALALPLAPVLLLWIGLGCRRARRTDPRRQQRGALADLPAAIAAVPAATAPAARATALRQWQQLAALAFGSGHAAPSAATFAEAVRREALGATDATVAAWEKLWSEADAALYSRATALPGDWAARAATAARAARLRGLSFFAALRPSNLWPLAVVAFLLLGLVPDTRAAGAGTDSYRKAEFTNAEQTWRAGLAVTPDDWALRHNLGLALAQQNRWSEAAAQWGVSFLAAPRDPSVRWHLALGLERAEFTQPELAALSAGRGLAGLARLAAPAEWQRVAVAGAVLVALALAAVLLGRHFPQRRGFGIGAAVLGLAGVVALTLAFAALHFYGPLAHPDAVLVWKSTELRSVPTDAGDQKPEPLAAGSIAVWQKSFFGWDQLLFANGQTGWTRRENIQPLYPKKAGAAPQR